VFSWLNPIQAFTVDITLITTLLVISVHLAFRAGIFSLATMGFAAVGAYTSAILVTQYGWGQWDSLAAGVVVASVLAAAFAIPVLRLRGIYLALGTLALSEVIIVTIQNLDIANKGLGISGIPLDVNTTQLVVILLVVFVLLQLDRRSHFGRAANAVRLDERTAQGLGINVWMVRIGAFVASAAFAAFAGGLEAHRTGVISPEQYTLTALIPVFTYALIGGEGNWIGPVLTTWALITFRHQLNFADSEWDNIVFGVGLILVMMVAPSGLSDPTLIRKVKRSVKRLISRNEPAETPAAPPPPEPEPAAPAVTAP
jgi:branched-chain amino acid transport system permease protein